MKNKINVIIRFKDRTLDDDPLASKWRLAMQQECAKVLSASLEIFLAETFASRDTGYKSGAYHMTTAKLAGMVDQDEETERQHGKD